MIQAPQLQYIPAQQPVQPTYQQPGAYNPVQYAPAQNPGVFYNYPTASSYMPAQPYSTNKSQFNGVNIEIINPQGQGVAPNQMAMAQPAYIPAQTAIPAQFMPLPQPVMMPQPQYPTSQAVVQAPQIAQQPVAAPAAQPVVSQPAPAVIPQPVIPAPQVATPVVEQPAAQPVAQQPVAPKQATPAAAPVVEQPTVQNQEAIAESFAGRLNTSDLDAQGAAIEEIAKTVKQDAVTGPALLDTQVFDALVNIVNQDTSALAGPTQEVIALRQKPENQLTPQELAIAATPSPLEKAEINKQHALYTIAFMQQRLNAELEQKGQGTVPLKDLPCIETIVGAAKANPNPMIRIGAIASLSHIARPEYKADLTTVFELAKADEDARVQEAATKAIQTLQ